MFCEECGFKNDDASVFCENCGRELAKNEVGEAGAVPPKMKRNGKRLKVILSAISILFVAVGSILYFGAKQVKANEYREYVDKADKYFEELDYENAEIAYLEAIQINPKAEKPYLQLSEVYVEQERFEEALLILSQGKKQIKSKTIQEKSKDVKEKEEEFKVKKEKEKVNEKNRATYEKYVRETLAPLYGMSNGTQLEFPYAGNAAYGYPGDGTKEHVVPDDMLGIKSVSLEDLNDDEEDELILVRVSKVDEAGNRGLLRATMNIHVYSMKDGSVFELEQTGRKMEYSVYTMCRMGSMNVFVKTTPEGRYLTVFNTFQHTIIQRSSDVFVEMYQMKDASMVCKKSVTLGYNKVVDSTKCVENTTDTNEQLKPGEILVQEIPLEEVVVPYYDLVDTFMSEVETCYSLGDWFKGEIKLTTDFRQMSRIGFAFPFSEKMDEVSDILRISGIWTKDSGKQIYEYFDYSNLNLDLQAAPPVESTKTEDVMPQEKDYIYNDNEFSYRVTFSDVTETTAEVYLGYWSNSINPSLEDFFFQYTKGVSDYVEIGARSNRQYNISIKPEKDKVHIVVAGEYMNVDADFFSAVSPEEEPVEGVSDEEMKQMILSHYENLKEDDGSYTILDDEMENNGNEISAIVRYRMSDLEAENIIASGGMPSPNRLHATVVADKITGVASEEHGDTWNLW